MLIAIPFKTLEDVNSVCKMSREMWLNFCGGKGDYVFLKRPLGKGSVVTRVENYLEMPLFLAA